jgi:chromosome segregation ATPase
MAEGRVVESLQKGDAMSEDLTKKLPKRDSDKLDLIVTAIQALTSKTTSLQGNVALIQLRLDAVDSRLDGIDSRLNGIDSRLDRIDSRLNAIDSRVEALNKKVDAVDSRVEALDKKIEERFYDTRPIWEQVVANVTQLHEGQQQLQQTQQRLELEFGEMKQSVTSLYEGQKRIEEKLNNSSNGSREIKTFLRDILRRMSIFNDTLVTIQADYRDIYDRVRHLELRHS